MKKKVFILLFIFYSTSFIFSMNYITPLLSLRLIINSGVQYNFPITTDYSTEHETVAIDVPIGVTVDIRFQDYFALNTGLELLYGLRYRKIEVGKRIFPLYLNSFYMRIPVVAKFYPLVSKHERYSNLYIGVGGILHFWPVNTYYLISQNNAIKSGNAYSPSHSFMPPGNIYTPANIGMKIAIGNQFPPVGTRFLFGIELFADFMFIPRTNGYYFNNNYNRGNEVILEFDSSIGACISFCINLI